MLAGTDDILSFGECSWALNGTVVVVEERGGEQKIVGIVAVEWADVPPAWLSNWQIKKEREIDGTRGNLLLRRHAESNNSLPPFIRSLSSDRRSCARG